MSYDHRHVSWQLRLTLSWDYALDSLISTLLFPITVIRRIDKQNHETAV